MKTNTGAIIVSQLGFLPDATKHAYLPFQPEQEEFSVLAVETRFLGAHADGSRNSGCPVAYRGKPRLIEGDPLGVRAVLEFSEVTVPGLYQLLIDGKRSHPFFIRKDLYIRTAFETFRYSQIQRCGDAVPGWHAACHLDDAEAPGGHRDVTGGWHDAGDLRKWVDHTFWQAVGIITARNAWGPVFRSSGNDELTEELLWGNRYFLAMQDPETGLIWHDVGGEESDNSWTDNIPGSGDDRHLNPAFLPHLQYKFAWIEAEAGMLLVRAGRSEEAERCIAAAERAFSAAMDRFPPRQQSTLAIGFALLAALSLMKARKDIRFAAPAKELAQLLLSLQEKDNNSGVSGYFYENSAAEENEVFNDFWQGLIPPLALFEAGKSLTEDLSRLCTEGFRRYLDGRVLPLSAESSYQIVPIHLCRTPGTHDSYRRYGDSLHYRFFLPCMSSRSGQEHFIQYGQGTNTFLMGHAYLLLAGWRRFGETAYRDLALRFLEWAHGANPFGMCLVTGRGTREPYPHSRYLGLIPGAMMNGITGAADDSPHLGCGEYDMEWQTLEYWSPQQAQYLMCLTLLSQEYSLESDIGVRRV